MAQHFDANAASNGLDWLLRQRQLQQADSTPFKLIHRDPAVGVRHYPAAGPNTAEPIPIVLIPPLAVRPSICDLLPERSLVRCLAGRGFDVYLLDWAEPGRDHDGLGLQAYALDTLPRALGVVRSDSGSARLSLVGYCMGGLFALLYAGNGPDDAIAGIVTIATPVDMHDAIFTAALARALQHPARALRRHTNLRLRDIDPALFHVPGRVNALAFKLASPMSGPTAFAKLLRRLDDRQAVAAHSTTQAWLGQMRAYPGRLAQDFIGRIWIDNELMRGPLRFGEITSDLARIDCPILAIAGEHDTVVGHNSTRRLLDRVASVDQTHLVAPGGHVGVLAGVHAPDYCWPRLADWLARRE